MPPVESVSGLNRTRRARDPCRRGAFPFGRTAHRWRERLALALKPVDVVRAVRMVMANEKGLMQGREEIHGY